MQSKPSISYPIERVETKQDDQEQAFAHMKATPAAAAPISLDHLTAK